VGGTIHSPYSMEPHKNLGLDLQKATKLAVKIYAHLAQHACKLVSTGRAFLKTFDISLPRSMGYC